MAMPSLMNRQETAAAARLTLPTLNKLIRGGKGPTLTWLGGKSFVSDVEFARWIGARTQPHQQRQSEGVAA
ncbi:MAG: hypothetical protein ACRYHQ_35825 [Janthinobacterium lividum]